MFNMFCSRILRLAKIHCLAVCNFAPAFTEYDHIDLLIENLTLFLGYTQLCQFCWEGADFT